MPDFILPFIACYLLLLWQMRNFRSSAAQPGAANLCFLHHSDHQRMMLVLRPLGRDNYLT